jgi:hypothetical protein
MEPGIFQLKSVSSPLINGLDTDLDRMCTKPIPKAFRTNIVIKHSKSGNNAVVRATVPRSPIFIKMFNYVQIIEHFDEKPLHFILTRSAARLAAPGE